MLDDVNYLGADPHKPGGGGKYEGRLDEGQLEFVRNVLAHTPDDTLIVMVMHIPLRTFLDERALPEPAGTARSFLRAVRGAPLHGELRRPHAYDRASLFRRRRRLEGRAPHHHHVLTALSGSWWSGPYDHRGVASADSRDGTPNGFHILSVDGLTYTTRFIPAKEPNGRQMRLSIESRFHGISKDADRDFRPGETVGLAASRATRWRLDAHRQRVRRRREDEGQDDHRRSRADRDGAPAPCPIRSCKKCSRATRRQRSPGSRPSLPRTSGSRACPATCAGTYPVVVEATANMASRQRAARARGDGVICSD